MAIQTRNFTDISVSTDRNNPSFTKSVLSAKTASKVECVLSLPNGSWANKLGSGILTIAVQQQLSNKTWINVVQSTFDARSTNSDGLALFSVTTGGLGNKNLRLACWCTTPITLDATVTLT